jgi:hypothetical protein
MPELSLSTLTVAIGSMIADREQLLARIASEPPEVDEEERLSGAVMDIDRALGEIADVYERQRQGNRTYPAYETLIAGMQRA